jgi:subtilisin-like proprotein convertase family protein
MQESNNANLDNKSTIKFMKNRLIFLLAFCANNLMSQTFVGASDSILDFQTVNVPAIVTLPQTALNTTSFGLETVCINLTHTYLADITIELVAPDGTTKMLVQGAGGGDDNMTNTCFNSSTTNSIASGVAPFTGTYQPMGQMGAVNNGQNPNGTWFLKVTDGYGQDQGEVQDWSLTFGSSPSTFFQFTESNLPIVIIETNGQSIQNDLKITADMGIIFNGLGNRNHVIDPANEYSGKIGIEYRGNYSLSLPQKPYSFELRDAAGLEVDYSLLGMPTEHDWLLLANYNDKSFARNMLPFHLFDTMGHYSVRNRYVDVVLNGDYQGIYLLAEKIKRDSNRIDISKLLLGDTVGLDLSGGYVFKVDYWDNSNSWESNFSPIGFPGLDIHYVYYYPSFDVIAPQQKDYLKNFVDELETALYSSYFTDTIYGYRKYISVRSFLDYFIVNELARNVDGYKKSRFFFKDKDYPDGTYSKLHAGPVWDFDWAWKDMWSGSEDGSGFMYSEVAQDVNAPGWYIRLLQDTLFANELRCRYDDLRRSVLDLDYLHAKIDSAATFVNESQNWHFAVWGNMGVATGTPETQAPAQSYAEEVQRLKDWITRRINWLDANMPGTLYNCSMSGINSVDNQLFSAHPNPFENFIEIVVSINESLTITLSDANGRILLNKTDNQLAGKLRIDNLENLDQGIYLLKIEQEGNSNTIKLIHTIN